jgi:hypothetical protein
VQAAEAASEKARHDGCTNASRLSAEQQEALNEELFSFVRGVANETDADAERVQQFLAAGADPNYAQRWNDKIIDAVLLKASREGLVRIVNTLLKGGADPNIQDQNRQTPIWDAAGYGTTASAPEVLDLLLSAGANPFHTSGEGEPTLLEFNEGFLTGKQQMLAGLPPDLHPEQRKRREAVIQVLRRYVKSAGKACDRSKDRGRRSETAKCEVCDGEALSESELKARFKKLGIGYQEFGDQSSNPYGVSQHDFDAIERLKGFQCMDCGKVFCLDCVKRHAKPHPNGGRACMACGGMFGHYR